MKETLVSFKDSLEKSDFYPLKATSIETLQINLGKMCNQACKHCHVEAGPNRTEMMDRLVMMYCIDVFSKSSIKIADLTGGAPEMNPYFKWFVERLYDFGAHVKVRSNLTILMEEGYEDMVDFFVENEVEVIASLPCYTEDNVNAQRGDKVFEASIEALKKLNAAGYGVDENSNDGSGLVLNLVYNPGGPFLPPAQAGLEADYKRELKERFDISFNALYAITNMPIGRYKDSLKKSDEYIPYMTKLIEAYNGDAAKGVMCRTALSVDYEGYLYDCDFNQMLEMKVGGAGNNSDKGQKLPTHIKDFNQKMLEQREIEIGSHCYGCTAGAGSSCGGVTA